MTVANEWGLSCLTMAAREADAELERRVDRVLSSLGQPGGLAREG